MPPAVAGKTAFARQFHKAIEAQPPSVSCWVTGVYLTIGYVAELYCQALSDLFVRT